MSLSQSTRHKQCKLFIKELDEYFAKENPTKAETNIASSCVFGMLVYGYSVEEVREMYPKVDTICNLT